MRLTFADIGHSFLARTVFEHIDLSVNASEIVALAGPSGCGKSTLLQIGCGLIDPAKGRVVREYDRHAMVFQEPRLLPWLTARDNIAYGLRPLGTTRPERRRIAERRAAEVGLEARDLDKYPAELSGGMRQRVSVARALAIEPDMIFLDEPFTALDVGLRRTLQNLVIQACAREHFSALFVTHDLAEAVRMAHRLVVMSAKDMRLTVERVIAGVPGHRTDREIFDTLEAWSREPEFAELFEGLARGEAA